MDDFFVFLEISYRMILGKTHLFPTKLPYKKRNNNTTVNTRLKRENSNSENNKE